MFNNEARGTGNEKNFNWICFNNSLNYNNYSKNNWYLHLTVDEDMKEKIFELRNGSTYNQLIKQHNQSERQFSSTSDVREVEKKEAGTQTDIRTLRAKTTQTTSRNDTTDQQIKTVDKNKNQLPIKRSYELRKSNVYYKI